MKAAKIIPNLEVKALALALVQVVDPIMANQAHLVAVATVGRLANRMVCKNCIASNFVARLRHSRIRMI